MTVTALAAIAAGRGGGAGGGTARPVRSGRKAGRLPRPAVRRAAARVAIVRALAMRPRLMLLDEVTSALDPELVADVLDVIRELAEGGMTMLIATHEMGFARDIASRVCFLADGQIVEQAPPAPLFSEAPEERTRRFLRRITDAGRP